MILKRPPQAAHRLMSTENLRANRAAQPMIAGGALELPSAAAVPLPASSVRCGHGPGHEALGHHSAQEMKPRRGYQSRQLLQ